MVGLATMDPPVLLDQSDVMVLLAPKEKTALLDPPDSKEALETMVPLESPVLLDLSDPLELQEILEDLDHVYVCLDY